MLSHGSWQSGGRVRRRLEKQEIVLINSIGSDGAVRMGCNVSCEPWGTPEDWGIKDE